MKRDLVLVLAAVLAVTGVAPIVQAAPAAPAVIIVGGETWDKAVAISPGVEYEASVSTTHLYDWFYVDVTPGQIIDLPFSTTNEWSSSFFFLYDQAHTDPALVSQYATAGGQSYVFNWMGSNKGGSSTPTRYYFLNKWLSGTNVYRFSFTLADQQDAGTTGDAGGNFASATVLSMETTPSVIAPNNLLGASDSDDYYLIQLPTPDVGESPVEYLFLFRDLTWPESYSGYIVIQLYDSLRVPDTTRSKLINSPAVTPFTWDITDCGPDGCYISVTSHLPQKWYQLGYGFRVAPKQKLFLPLVVRS